jgi:hypothetical protein
MSPTANLKLRRRDSVPANYDCQLVKLAFYFCLKLHSATSAGSEII